MHTTRREFTGGALGLALIGRPARADPVAARPGMNEAIQAIGNYADAHCRFYNLPNMTLSVTTPDGFSTTINRGFADLEDRRPIRPDTLFQIGSITKSITAAIIHQLAAEGRLSLNADARPLLPEAPWPDAKITVQQLLDHVSGLPDDGPTHVSGGRLWVGYAPGEHWWYSNVGYVLLGRIAERAGAAPLQQLIERRVLSPIGMNRSRGVVTAADRLISAQGYEPVDRSLPYVRGSALRPAPWMEISDGAGCVASAAADMTLYLRSLANAAQGRGGLGLSPEGGRAFTGHFVASGEGDMRYGNGLMLVTERARAYLHHTGGGPFGSAAFHLDTVTGVGAFACSTISAFADYRPTKLTLFAVQAIEAARRRRPLPAALALEEPLADAGSFVGRYGEDRDVFTVRAKQSLVLDAAGHEAPLQYWGDDLFRTSHPSFADFALQFERAAGRIVAASWGPKTFAREGAPRPKPVSDPILARHAGRFVSDSPLGGVARIVERGGRLWLGTEIPFSRIDRTTWRVGKLDWTPERAQFADFVDARPQTVVLFGTTYERRDL